MLLRLLTAGFGTNRPSEDVRIHGSFRRDNGHATDNARRQNLTPTGHSEAFTRLGYGSH
jgi:hypothetical protein